MSNDLKEIAMDIVGFGKWVVRGLRPEFTYTAKTKLKKGAVYQVEDLALFQKVIHPSDQNIPRELPKSSEPPFTVAVKGKGTNGWPLLQTFAGNGPDITTCWKAARFKPSEMGLKVV